MGLQDLSSVPSSSGKSSLNPDATVLGHFNWQIGFQSPHQRGERSTRTATEIRRASSFSPLIVGGGRSTLRIPRRQPARRFVLPSVPSSSGNRSTQWDTKTFAQVNTHNDPLQSPHHREKPLNLKSNADLNYFTCPSQSPLHRGSRSTVLGCHEGGAHLHQTLVRLP